MFYITSDTSFQYGQSHTQQSLRASVEMSPFNLCVCLTCNTITIFMRGFVGPCRGKQQNKCLKLIVTLIALTLSIRKKKYFAEETESLAQKLAYLFAQV